ncbi:MAG: carboxymuconolactone decarboxylase family protein, partial [Propylenella sp.]
MTDRFRPLRREELDPRQRAVFDAIQAGPRGTVPSIFHLYLESPELAARVQELGAFCRYGSGLPQHLSELAILVVARHWDAEYEWRIHEGEARKAGLSEEAIAAIRRGEEPHFDDADARLVCEFLTEYLAKNDV